jgi:hypothetical protein
LVSHEVKLVHVSLICPLAKFSDSPCLSILSSIYTQNSCVPVPFYSPFSHRKWLTYLFLHPFVTPVVGHGHQEQPPPDSSSTSQTAPSPSRYCQRWQSSHFSQYLHSALCQSISSSPLPLPLSSLCNAKSKRKKGKGVMSKMSK